MPFELKMPKLGESVTEGTIGKWLKQPGEAVKKYDLLVEVQTDKVNTEIPSEVDGTLSEIKVKEGETVSVGTVLAVLETGAAGAEAKGAGAKPAEAKAAEAKPAAANAAGAEAKAAAPVTAQAGEGKAGASPAAAEAPAAPATTAAQQAPAQTAPAQQAPAQTAPAQQPPAQTAPAQPAPSDASSGNGKAAPPRPEVRATPAVRKLAAEHGIDIAQIDGSGLGGRVSRQDVEQFVASRGAAAPQGGAPQGEAPQPQQASRTAPTQAPRPAPLAGDTVVPLTQMRRAIATNMVQAWSAPHAHAVMEIDMTNLMRFRDTVKADFQKREGFDLSPAAFIVKAAVEALSQIQAVNASWTDQGVVLRKAINIGYAVALGEDGLVVPVIKNADEKSITGLMRAIRDVVDRAKAKKLTLDDFQGGTFTVNNTGPLGTFVSSPIVPPGQAAIISSESISKRLVVLDDDSIAIRQMMNLVIGFDHRAIDGSTAAKFLITMRDWLQGINEAVPL